MTTQAAVRTCGAAVGMYCGFGQHVPIVPTAIAIIAVVIVRIVVWTKSRSYIWNFAVMALCALASFATVEGSDMNSFRAFWCGVGYGGLGVGIVEIGKSAVGNALKERFAKAMNVLFGVKET